VKQSTLSTFSTVSGTITESTWRKRTAKSHLPVKLGMNKMMTWFICKPVLSTLRKTITIPLTVKSFFLPINSKIPSEIQSKTFH
jgi:hypothetical protein